MCPKTEEEINQMSKVPYAFVVGSLIFTMVWTSLDIAHSMGVITRLMEHLVKEHWQAVKWILRYLRGTNGYSLHFGCSKISLQGYADVDMAGDKEGVE